MASEENGDLLVRNARIDGGEADLVDVVVRAGRIQSIAAAATGDEPRSECPVIDARGGYVLPPFAEPHSHPDKVYSRERITELGNPPIRSREDQMQRQRDLKSMFTVSDVAERAERFLRDCAQEGIGVIAGQADIDSVTELRSFTGLLEARQNSSSWIDLVVTAFPQEGVIGDPRATQLLREALKMGADRIGGWPNNEASYEDSLEHLRTVFELAEEFDVPIDINIDYFTDPTERLLEPLAEMTIANGMQGRVNANHVGALETYNDEDARRVIEKVAQADISITVCPMNLAGTRPYRGVSRPNELLDAGVEVAIGIGNYEDNWEFIGVLDPLERARIAWHALGLSERESGGIDEAWHLVTGAARSAIGRPTSVLEVGSAADFVVLSTPDRTQALRNEAVSRRYVRRGKILATRIVESEIYY